MQYSGRLVQLIRAGSRVPLFAELWDLIDGVKVLAETVRKWSGAVGDT